MLAYGATLVLLAAAGGVGVLAIAFGSGYLFIGAVGPLHGELLHARVHDTTRATALSLVSMAGMTGLMIAALALPPVADTRRPARLGSSAPSSSHSAASAIRVRESTPVTRSGGTA